MYPWPQQAVVGVRKSGFRESKEADPPSAAMVCPMMKPASSEQRKTASLAISIGLPDRARGMIFAASSASPPGIVVGDGRGVIFHGHPTGSDSVDANPPVGQLDRDRPRIGDNRAFGGGVERILRCAQDSVDRGNVANASAAIEHPPRDVLGQEKLRPKIHLKQEVEFFGLYLEKRLGEGNAGIVDQAIDPAEEFDGPLAEIDCLIDLSEVGRQRRGALSHSFDFLNGRDRTFLAMGIMQDDIGALAREFQRRFPGRYRYPLQ